MTAQIIIMNKLCIGVASDSSVTLMGQRGPQRTFPTAEKIFPLPAPHTLVVVHSGSTELLGVPYSVMVGEWIRTLPSEPLPTVADYGAHLRDWMAHQASLFTRKEQDAYFSMMVRETFLAVRSRILSACEEQGLGKDDWDSPVAGDIIDHSITGIAEYLAERPALECWDAVDGNALVLAHADLVDEVREWVFDDTPRTAAGDIALNAIAVAVFAAFVEYGTDAVLLFAGYGADQLFASSQQLTCQGFLDGHLRTGPGVSSHVSTDMNSTIIPLGQTEAARTFLDGVHPDISGAAHQRLHKFVTASKELINAGAALSSQLDRLADEAHEGLDSDIEEESRSKLVQPMLDTVAALPPAEVVRMAEALVGLQVLRQLTQADAETVGGPIDLALVTRHEGVQWIRHKSLTGARRE